MDNTTTMATLFVVGLIIGGIASAYFNQPTCTETICEEPVCMCGHQAAYTLTVDLCDENLTIGEDNETLYGDYELDENVTLGLILTTLDC